MQTTVTSKGQVTIPKMVRDRLDLNPGDKVEFVLEENGTVRLIPVRVSAQRLTGTVPKSEQVETLYGIEMAIAKAASKS